MKTFVFYFKMPFIIIMYRNPSILLHLIFLTSSPFCFGQDIDSYGHSLVGKYLESSNTNEREDLLKPIEGLKVNFAKIKEWVRASGNYTPQQWGLHRELVSIGEKKGECFVYIPSSYTPDKSWPVVLALHGVGGSGYGQATGWLKSSAHNNEFIFLAPTYGPGLWWNEEAERFVFAVYDKVKQDYNIDTNRVYFTGFSSGGHGTWYMAIRYPWLFAAINPIAGECPIPSLLVNLKTVPVYIIHGIKDTVIPVEAARDTSSRLEKFNYNIVYKELPELKHQFPVNETKVVLDWFRLHKRSLYAKRVRFSTESSKYSVSYWIEITKFSELIGQVSNIPKDVSGHLVKPEGFTDTESIEAEIMEENNEIHLTTHEIKALKLYLADELVEMKRPLRIFINGKSVYSGKLDRSVRTIFDTVGKRIDREALFSVYLVPSD